MSEQNSGAQGEVTDGTEPSMEDILASIRKIIADDVPVGETAVEPVNNAVMDEISDLVSSPASEVEEVEALSEDSVFDLVHDTDPMPAQVTDLNIEDLVENGAAAEANLADDSENIFDLIENVSETPQAEVVSEEASEDLDLDSILADIVDEAPEVISEPAIEAAIDPLAELIDADLVEGEADVDAPETEDPDLTLVKSLMADLTDPVETNDDPEGDEGDILDAILDNALEDELATHEDELEDELAIPPLEPEVPDAEDALESIIAVEPEIIAAPAPVAEGDALSLAAIAAAAEEEAAMVAAATISAAPKVSQKAAVQDTDNQETIPMAKASKKDVIIDEVTETATADVFASLNKAVEDKAMVEERGDRIGDLVMEALRPMLKEWLDKNLKTIVERAVTKEVKRISSGK